MAIRSQHRLAIQELSVSLEMQVRYLALVWLIKVERGRQHAIVVPDFIPSTLRRRIFFKLNDVYH